MDDHERDLAEASASGQGYCYEVSARLRDSGAHGPTMESLIRALDYHLLMHSHEEALGNGELVPMLDSTQGSYPPRLEDVGADELETWASMFTKVEAPVIRSRLGDLLWQKRYGEAYRYGAGAAQEYVRLARLMQLRGLACADSLVRAIQIGRALNDSDLVRDAVRESVKAVRLSIDADEPEPGVALMMLAALCHLPPAQQPAELDDLVQAAIHAYADDPWNLDSAVSLAMSRSANDPVRRDEYARARVQAWETAGRAATGLVSAAHFQKAIELATALGVRDLIDPLRLQLQAIPLEDELATVSASVEVAEEDIAKFIDGFVEAGDWRASLSRFGTYCTLPADRTETVEFVRRLMAEHPLQFLASGTIVGDLNQPIRYLSTDDDHLEAATYQHESNAIEIWGGFAAQILDAILADAGPDQPTKAQLEELFTTELIRANVAERLAQSVLHYMSGEFDEAALVALPRIEAIIREMCRLMDIVIFTEPSGGKPGRLVSLGTLLGTLEGRFPERHRHYLQVLLVEPLGVNLRNRGLHGLMTPLAKTHAALVLQVACLLRLVAVGIDSDSG